MKNSKIYTISLSVCNYIILFSIIFWCYMLRNILTYFIELFRVMLHIINISEVSNETKYMGILTMTLIVIGSITIKEKSYKSIYKDKYEILGRRMSQALVLGGVVTYIILHVV